MAKIVSAFDQAFKFETKINLDDIVDAISKLSLLSFGESLTLAHNLYFSQLKVINYSSKRFLTSKLSEFRSGGQLIDIPEDVRTSLCNLIQSDEVGQLDFEA